MPAIGVGLSIYIRHYYSNAPKMCKVYLVLQIILLRSEIYHSTQFFK